MLKTKSLNERIDRLAPDNDWDDVESITSATTSRFKTLRARRENELLKQNMGTFYRTAKVEK